MVAGLVSLLVSDPLLRALRPGVWFKLVGCEGSVGWWLWLLPWRSPVPVGSGLSLDRGSPD
jgi:hypothetical protein